MRRRDFITLIGSATALPFVARAEQKSMPVIGYLSVGFPQLQHPFVFAFHEGLKEAGFVAGENLTIEYRWAEERYERLPRLAADLVGRKVEVIVATGELPLRIAASATSTIPIVFTIGSDPVQSGLVASLARPDRNITGFTAIATELISKRFELVSELLPKARKIAVLMNSNASGVSEVTIRLAQQAVNAKGMGLLILEAGDDNALELAFASMVRERADALVVSADAFFFLRREQITALAARYAVPTIYELQGFVDAGGLISYGPDVAALRRYLYDERYVDRDHGLYTRRTPRPALPAG